MRLLSKSLDPMVALIRRRRTRELTSLLTSKFTLSHLHAAAKHMRTLNQIRDSDLQWVTRLIERYKKKMRDSEERSRALAVFHPPQLKRVACAADGNCMYHSVIKTMRHAGLPSPGTPSMMRTALASHIRSLPESRARNLALRRVIGGAWGQDYELQQLSRMLRVCIFVKQTFDTHAPQWQSLLPNASTTHSVRDHNSRSRGCNSRMIFLLNTGVRGDGVHFDALIPS